MINFPLCNIFRVCIASILRLTAIWNPPDIIKSREFTSHKLNKTTSSRNHLVNFAHTYLRLILQLGLVIVISCLPMYDPLLTLFLWLYHSIGGYYKTSRYHSSTARSQDRHKVPDSSNPERPWIESETTGSMQLSGRGPMAITHSMRFKPMQSGAIVVNTRVDVV